MTTEVETPARDLGLIEPQEFTFAAPPHEMVLQSGEKLGPITLAYETYGELNAAASNAILVLHAFSGDAHAAGFHKGAHKPGWWNDMVGPGKAFDTNQYFVVSSNVIGGCKGSTGPSSINPATGKPYGLDFPLITIADMVEAQRHLIDHLGIERLLCVAGGSMGGMQVLQWLKSYPQRICAAIPIATSMRHSPQQIAFNEVGRQAVMADPHWMDGDYYQHHNPHGGLAVARMIGHITYMSEVSMAEKFGRRVRRATPDLRLGDGQETRDSRKAKFQQDFEVGNYLMYNGDNFVKRFDANSYLYITTALDQFDLAEGKPLQEIFQGLQASLLVIAFKSDWLYPAHQSRDIVRACKLARVDTTFCEVNSTYGHDAFLVEVAEQTHLISHFLHKVCARRDAGLTG